MKKNVTILALIVLLLSHLQSFAQCPSNSQTVIGSSSDLNINSGQTVCIVSGTQTGTINFSGNGTLYIGTEGTLSSNNINNFNSGNVINIYGNVSFANAVNFSGGTINNYNKLSFGNNPNFNGPSTITNFANGTITLGQSTTLGNGGKIFNYGFIDAKADFTTNKGTGFININRIHIYGNFNPDGAVNNSGIIVSNRFINFNDGEPFINLCRLVAVGGFNNNNSKFENHGLIWVPGDKNSTNLIQLNNNILNDGYIRTPRLINNAALTNNGGSVRIEGSSDLNDAGSRNNGSGNIIGGTVGDASNDAKSPAYSFDDNGGSISGTYSLVPAYDTTSALYSANCSPYYFGYSISGIVYNDPNGLTDNNIGKPSGDALLPTEAIYANLVGKTSNTVVSSVQVDAVSGIITFTGVTNGDYILIISTVQASAGQASPAVKMPTGWIGVGEFLGEGDGSDNNPDSKLSITISDKNITYAKFGIQELPVAEERTVFLNKVVPEEKYTLNAPVSSILPLEGNDPYEGVLGENSSFVITSLPANAKLFYDGHEIINPVQIDGNFDLVPPVGVFGINPSIIPNYNPSLLEISFTDEFPGATKFTYSVMDAAGKYSVPADYNISALSILPITISNLKGSLNNNHSETQLNWQILGAEGALNCIVERSLNGQQFISVATINATGNGNFKYTDNLSGVLGIQANQLIYYRLKITNSNGLASYSNIIRLHLNPLDAVLITPNPTKNQILISGLEEKNIVSLLDTQGKTLQQQSSTNNNMRLNLGVYPAGIYYIKITGQNNNIISVKKIIKQ